MTPPLAPLPQMLSPKKGSVEHYLLALAAALLECGHTEDEVRAGFRALVPSTPPSAPAGLHVTLEPGLSTSTCPWKIPEDTVTMAVVIASVCGNTVEGDVRVACDDPRLPDDSRFSNCDCRATARAVLAAITPDLDTIIRMEWGKGYEARGDAPPAAVEAARREALEQAAKVADARRERWRAERLNHVQREDPEGLSAWVRFGTKGVEAVEIAAAIRALYPSQQAEETKP